MRLREMTKLFKKKDESEKRTVRYPLMLTKKEAETIEHSAKIRNLAVAEFIRRAALGRKADVHYETQIVLALRDVVQSIRKMYAVFIEKGIVPPVEEWRPVMKEALNAMLRISK